MHIRALQPIFTLELFTQHRNILLYAWSRPHTYNPYICILKMLLIINIIKIKIEACNIRKKPVVSVAMEKCFLIRSLSI